MGGGGASTPPSTSPNREICPATAFFWLRLAPSMARSNTLSFWDRAPGSSSSAPARIRLSTPFLFSSPPVRRLMKSYRSR